MLLAARRRIRCARPRRVPRNLVWAADLTGETSLVARLSRAIRRHGKPRILRTDSEPVFTSATFRLALLLLGIRHQRIDPHCPWQNGRIEGFFGTLKRKLDRLAVDSLAALDRDLRDCCIFYNHVRPHQNLGGATPAEAWAGISPRAAAPKAEYWFEGLGRPAQGLLPAAMRPGRWRRLDEGAVRPGHCPRPPRAPRVRAHESSAPTRNERRRTAVSRAYGGRCSLVSGKAEPES